MTEKTWKGWQIPDDVQQEVSYLLSMCARTNSAKRKYKIDLEIQDLIIWSSNNNRPILVPTMPGTKSLSRKEAILEQRERRG